jgi:hypothetical protein
LNRRVISEYRFAPGLLVRAAGLLLAGLGLLLVLVGLGVATLDWPVTVLTSAILVTAVLVCCLMLGGWAVTRRVCVVRLDDTGYRVRLLRGAGARQARWRDVEDVVAVSVRGTKGVLVRLRNGTATTIPAAVLDTDPEQFVLDVRSHLDRAHGYRRLQ